MSRKKSRPTPRRSREQATPAPPVVEYSTDALRQWCLANRSYVLGAVVVVAAAFVWAYWPTIGQLVAAWQSHADYSHGFLVPPLALLFLYVRRDRMPANWKPAYWAGGLLVLLSILMRWGGARIYLDALDGYSMLIWMAGVVLFFFGWRILWWSAPSLLFLIFMVPLPYRLESALRLPLQELATNISTYALVVLGYPAIADVNVIRVGDHTFGIAEACSGLRIFVGILALAVGYVIAVRRPVWIKALLVLSVLPVTLVANSTRIVVTAMLELRFSSELAHKFSHDIAGVVMIPFAACLFGLILLYLASLVKWEANASVEDVVKRQIAT